jgi:hypothetical protein
MSSPRSGRFFAKPGLAVILMLLAALGSPLHAQDTVTTTPADTMRRDTASAVGGGAPIGQGAPSNGQTGMRPDSLGPDSLRRDSLPRDTAAVRPPAAPVDSALAAACRESGGEPPDLLSVVFKATATAAEREAVALDVGGTLVELSRHQAPGAWYLRAPGSGINPLIADRLILQPNVLEVAATRCPP